MGGGRTRFRRSSIGSLSFFMVWAAGEKQGFLTVADVRRPTQFDRVVSRTGLLKKMLTTQMSRASAGETKLHAVSPLRVQAELLMAAGHLHGSLRRAWAADATSDLPLLPAIGSGTTWFYKPRFYCTVPKRDHCFICLQPSKPSQACPDLDLSSNLPSP